MAHETLTLEAAIHTAGPERHSEVERQFTTDYPAVFEDLKNTLDTEAITHIYLSHQDEEFNLRISEVTTHEGTSYVATLKDRGELTPDGLRRLEIETEVSEAAFRFYEDHGCYATLRKLRVRPASGVTVDWYGTDEPPVIEIEDGPHKQEASDFYRRFAPYLIERTGQAEVSSEALAYRLSPEVRQPNTANVSAETVVETIMAARAAGAGRLTAAIMGRSGSGKSTLARDVTEELHRRQEDDFEVTCLSTDDYHRGKAWLEAYNGGHAWQDWDATIVYDTAAMAGDIAKLIQGESIPRRVYDFVSQEPAIDGLVEPSGIILVEGICSSSPDLAEVRDFLFTLPASAATSIGRRLRRDVTEGRLNASLGNVTDILRYQLEYAEPAHIKRLAGL